LIVYLQASVPTLEKRIHRRGRSYEKTISTAYLEQLNQLYETWIESFALCPVLTVPSDTLDFVLHQSHLQLITDRVLERFQGREQVVFDSNEVGRQV
jgi:deoxyadenosine/deoxycytidine kinase